MAQTPIHKRKYDLFVSYGHADRERVNPIVDWLRRSAGLEIWSDTLSGDASKRTTQLLTNGIQSARGALFFLSSSWKNSTWCKDEHELALTERRSNDDYLVVAVQLDDLDIPPWFTTSNVLDFREFHVRSGADLLRSMFPDPRLDNDQDVYLADSSWRRLGRGLASLH
jgi:hypothetical protein